MAKDIPALLLVTMCQEQLSLTSRLPVGLCL
jgi:hypothetical protein